MKSLVILVGATVSLIILPALLITMKSYSAVEEMQESLWILSVPLTFVHNISIIQLEVLLNTIQHCRLPYRINNIYVYLTTFAVTAYGPVNVGSTKVVMLGIFLGLGLHIIASFRDLREMFLDFSDRCVK